MANRRLAAFADTYLRYMLQARLAEQQAEAVYGRQERNAQLQEGRERRRLALSDPTGRIASLTDNDDLVPSPDSLFQPLRKSIADSKSMGDLPTATDLRGQAGGVLSTAGYDKAGAVPTPTGQQIMPMRQQVSLPTDGALPSRSLIPAERPDIASLIAQREGKVGSLMSADEYETDLGAARAEMNARGGIIGQNKGQNEVFGDVRKRGDTLAADTLGQLLRQRRAIDPLDISKAGSEAGARENASINARYGNIDKLGELALAQNPALGNLTEGERRVAGNIQPLANAHAKLTNDERTGKGLATGILSVLGNPIGANYAGKFYSPEDLQFAQSAVEWGNIAGYIISGVAVRPDERQNIITSMVSNKNDPPQLKQQKERARVAFIQAAQISAGRGGDVAGRALAQAVLKGDLDRSIIGMLTMEPEVQAGFIAGLQGQ